MRSGIVVARGNEGVCVLAGLGGGGVGGSPVLEGCVEGGEGEGGDGDEEGGMRMLAGAAHRCLGRESAPSSVTHSVLDTRTCSPRPVASTARRGFPIFGKGKNR